jgi:hypothetical protein
MADFTNLEDEIPYPLPPTTVATTTTPAPTTTPPFVFQVPNSSALDQNTGPFKLPKKHQTLASTKAKKHVEKKKPANTVSSSSSHFSMEETISFLTTMEEVLPFGDAEWQMVVNLHNTNQQKFNKLRNTKIPTCTHIVQPMFSWPRSDTTDGAEVECC